MSIAHIVNKEVRPVMTTLRLVLGDQLSRSLSALRHIDAGRDIVLMVEAVEEATYVRHHRQKLVLVLSAMRHFAAVLRAEGLRVDYVRLDDRANRGSLGGELARACQRHAVDRVVATEPGEWRVAAMMRTWPDRLGIPVEIRPDDRFICSREAFAKWAAGRKTLRMEHFYRSLRRRTGWLMDGRQPAGGRWNYDADNRKRLPPEVHIPPWPRVAPDAVTTEVMRLVRQRFADHFGELDTFGWAVTRESAVEALEHFVIHRLGRFGDFQDAMQTDDDILFHATLSPYLNLGLLDPGEVCHAAIAAYRQGTAPLNSVEGFVRQVLGWREFVRGVYWTHMPAYAETNFLAAQRPLPTFYWTADTPLNCLHLTVAATRRNAYAHHIQRLMITGNFALLAGVRPAEVEAWYLAVYADAVEWVELPNTHGMALHADGGLLASKPYAASGAYINRMSDYCRTYRFDPAIKEGPKACPFNYLYWHFLIVNANRLRSNPRLGMPYRTLERMSAARRSSIAQRAASFLNRL